MKLASIGLLKFLPAIGGAIALSSVIALGVVMHRGISKAATMRAEVAQLRAALDVSEASVRDLTEALQAQSYGLRIAREQSTQAERRAAAAPARLDSRMVTAPQGYTPEEVSAWVDQLFSQ